MEGVEFKEEWQDEDFPRLLIFFNVIQIKCITSRIRYIFMFLVN